MAGLCLHITSSCTVSVLMFSLLWRWESLSKVKHLVVMSCNVWSRKCNHYNTHCCIMAFTIDPIRVIIGLQVLRGPSSESDARQQADINSSPLHACAVKTLAADSFLWLDCWKLSWQLNMIQIDKIK